MDIGSVLSRAWQIIWKHKVLWIFGILAGCANANQGSPNIQMQREANVSPNVQNFFANLQDWQIALLVLAIILVTLVFVVLVVFLSTVGKIGLIRGTQQADQGATSLAFGELFNGSLPYFWRVFGLNLLVGILTFLAFVLILIFGGLATIFTLGIFLICLIPLICLLVPIAWVVNVIVEQSVNAIVIENLGVTAGLRRGWEVVKTNLGTMIVMALILFLGVGVIGGLIIGLPIVLIVAPAVAGMIAGTPRATGGGLLVSALCFVAYLPVLVAASGILNGYTGSAWTLTFMRLTGRQAYSEPQILPPAPSAPAFEPPAPSEPTPEPPANEPAPDEPPVGS
jgi:hypothetical protein